MRAKMRLRGKSIGWGVCGSHCSYEEVLPQVQAVLEEGASVVPVLSHAAMTTTTRFGTPENLARRLQELTGHKPITSIVEAEPTGQKKSFDCFVIAPCTGNTLAKLANAFTDTPVLMAAKGTLRNLRPVVIAISTNDALGNNAKNIGILLNTRNVYFVPFGQDNPEEKPNSCVADFDRIADTVVAALQGRQLQPVLIERAKRAVK
ncbi:MAG TPA: dipicolinate synthase subunit B [Limnochordia bacterium]|nr:dipicolinate synthase subunit B [Limnochordia bacterium]